MKLPAHAALLLIGSFLATAGEVEVDSPRTKCLERIAAQERQVMNRLEKLAVPASTAITSSSSDPVWAEHRRQVVRLSGISSLSDTRLPWAVPRAVFGPDANGVVRMGITVPGYDAPGERAVLENEARFLARRRSACESLSGQPTRPSRAAVGRGGVIAAGR